MTLVNVLTKTRENAAYTVQLAASHDVKFVEGRLSPPQKMSYVFDECDINMEVFIRIKSMTPFPEYFCISLLHELSGVALSSDNLSWRLERRDHNAHKQ